MNENDLYEAIFKRKSIRNYDSAQIDQKSPIRDFQEPERPKANVHGN